MYSEKGPKIILLSLFLLLIGARIFALFFVESITYPETWEHEQIANNLLKGEGLYFTHLGAKYRNTAMVLYSLMCTTIYYFTNHSYFAVKIFQILLSALNCFLVYRISKMLFGNIVGLIAFALVSFHPGLVVYSVKLHPLTLDALLFTLSIYFLLLVIEKRKILKNGLLAGLSIGAALLTRATIGLFIPFALITIFLKMMKSNGGALRSIIYIATGIFLILFPLIIRNYSLFHKIVILPNDSGINFWRGNNPHTIGTANTLNGKSVLVSAPIDFLKEVKELDEFGQKRLFYQEARNFIKNNPGKSLILFGKKLYYFWWFSPTQGLNYPKSWLSIYKLYYSIILLLAISGFFTGIKIIPRQKRQMFYLLLLFFITVSIAQALYYVDGRHRWAIEPLVLIFSASGINFLWTKLS